MSCRSVVGIVLGTFAAAFWFLPRVAASSVVINEFSVEPVTSQWVELYNAASSETDISGWVLDDEGSESTKYTISEHTILPPFACIVFTSGNFNFNKSSADGARLLSGAALMDSYSYAKSPGEGITFARIPDGDPAWATASASPGSLNHTGDPCLPPPTPTQTPTQTATPKPAATATSAPSPTPSHSTSPTHTPTSGTTRTVTRMPTKRIVSDILGIYTVASDASSASDPAIIAGTDATASARSEHSLVFSLLFIGTGTGLLALAVSLQKTDIWKAQIATKKNHAS